MAKQREEGVTLSIMSHGGETPFFAELLGTSTGDAIKFLNEGYLEIQASYPGEFALGQPTRA